VLVEPPNERKGCLLPSSLHGSIIYVSRLVITTLSLWSGINIELHSTYLSVIFSGGTQIHKHLNVFFDWFPGFQSWNDWSDKKRFTCVYPPSSSFTRYWSNIGSAFTTCCVAEDLIDARFAWNNFDSKYRFQNSSEESYRTNI